MKFKTKLGCLCCLITTIIASTAAIVMSDDKVAAQNKEATYDYQLEKEAIKYVATSDVEPSTGRLKEGVIYNVGGNGIYLTSNGLVEYAVNQTNNGMAKVVTNKPQIKVLPSTSNGEVLFSNNVILDFDISYDQSKMYVETKRNVLVSKTYKESSYYQTKNRLVWKSYKKKVWFVWITVWYLDTESYQEEIIERTPVEVYQEQRSTSLSINLEDDSNFITRTISSVVDKYMPEVRTLSNTYKMPLAIVFLDIVINAVRTVLMQILSIVAEFVPVLDEVKTSFETLKGYDMFTGEKISLGWRIFGALTLLIGIVSAVFTFGASMAVVDVAADTVQVGRKLAKVADSSQAIVKLAKKADAAADTLKSTSNFADLSTDALRFMYKNTDEITDIAKKFDPDTAVDIIEQTAGLAKKSSRNLDALEIVTKQADNIDTVTGTSKSVLKNSSSVKSVGNMNVADDVMGNIRTPHKSTGITSDLFDGVKPKKTGTSIDNLTGNLKGEDLAKTFSSADDVIPTGPTAKTFDLYDTNTKQLVSNKSMHIESSSYDSLSKFKSTINKYLDDIDPKKWESYTGFQNTGVTGYKNGVNVFDGTLSGTRLDLYINTKGLDLDRLDALQDFIRQARNKGIEMIVYIV